MDDWLLKLLRIGMWIGLFAWVGAALFQDFFGGGATDRAVIIAAVMLVGAINCEHTAALLRQKEK